MGGIRRLLDERAEERSEGGSQTAILSHAGRKCVVGLINVSASGAMIRFRGELNVGDEVLLRLLDHAPLSGQVQWLKDGQVGVRFHAPASVAGGAE